MRVLRRGWTLLTASDPAFSRLRLASTTLIALVLTVLAVGAIAGAWGAPITVAVVGVVVAMITSLAVDDPTPRARAVSTALMVPGVAVSAWLAATFRSQMLVSDAVFVAVMVAAVYLRRWGRRGLAVGMVSFVTYFLVLFVRAAPSDLPVMVVCATVGAAVAWAVKTLLRPRHPDRDLRRELAAWRVRAGRSVDHLIEAAASGQWDERARSRLRQRVFACAEAAGAAEARLEDAEDRVWSTVDNDELAVRVFDMQLALERVTSLCVATLTGHGEYGQRRRHGVTTPAARGGLVAALRDLRSQLASPRPYDATAADRAGVDPILAEAIHGCAEAWRRTWWPELHPDETDLATSFSAEDDDLAESRGSMADDGQADEAGSEEGPDSPWRDLSRTALQVAVAAVVAIALGELVSPTRWFWAVIAAFVVFTGTSTREETLQKGWLRVVGTLAGVGAGVVVASVVGGNTMLSLVVIALCVFLGIYLLQISIAWMMFFITTMLGLLYGLMGMFSVDLLLVRLEETVVGAGAGALAAFLILPQSARSKASEDVGAFLESLEELLDSAGRTITGEVERAATPTVLSRARDLRSAMDTLRATADPLTGRWAGITNRTGLRRLVLVAGACEHHGRALARVSAAATGLASAAERAGTTSAAFAAVVATVRAVRTAFDAGADASQLPSSDAELEALHRQCESLAGRECSLCSSALRHLHALDSAVREIASLTAPAPQEPRPLTGRADEPTSASA
ncbi:MAG: FUSC family protein [Nocardioides sp.]